MFIRETRRRYKDKTYSYYLLLESIRTPKGPRQRTVCPLGTLAPRPAEEWLTLARKIEDAILGQQPLLGEGSDPELDRLAKKASAAYQRRHGRGDPGPQRPPCSVVVSPSSGITGETPMALDGQGAALFPPAADHPAPAYAKEELLPVAAPRPETRERRAPGAAQEPQSSVAPAARLDVDRQTCLPVGAEAAADCIPPDRGRAPCYPQGELLPLAAAAVERDPCAPQPPQGGPHQPQPPRAPATVFPVGVPAVFGPAAASASPLYAHAPVIAVVVDRVETQECRTAGPLHVGHQMWKRLAVDEILAAAGLAQRARQLTEAMVLNRLVEPLSERGMAKWFGQTAISDILGIDLTSIGKDPLYRNMDRLHPARDLIEKALASRERHLFNLQDAFYLYDLTSTYFEGQARGNPRARLGYSRDDRPDAKQLVVGLVLNEEGFPKAHEVFDGNRVDTTTVEDMLRTLEERVGKRPGTTVIVDRGMAAAGNLATIKAHQYHYVVMAHQSEREAWLEEIAEETGWVEVQRPVSPTNPGQRKSRVEVKSRQRGDELVVLCQGEGRREKDRAIRERAEKKLVADLEKLRQRVASGRLRAEGKIYEAAGRLKGRYPRAARYYDITVDPAGPTVRWEVRADRKALAEKLDGAYVIRTDHRELAPDQVWRLYMLLERVEGAFRDLKQPLRLRPLHHQLPLRAETHIFLTVLAYHLLVCIEKQLVEAGIHTSWETLRRELATHQIQTTVLPTRDGWELRLRKDSRPEPGHRKIYAALGLPARIMRPVRSWSRGDSSEENIEET